MRLIRCAVHETELRPRSNEITVLQHRQVRIERDPAEHKHRLHPMEQIQFSNQIRPASEDLAAGRLVIRRHATDRSSDVGVVQNEAVFPSRALRLIRESSLPQRAIEKFAGAVTRKHATGPVCAMGSWSETNHQQARRRISEPGHRPAPVLLPAICSPLHAPDLLPMGDQTGTSETVDDLVVENFERIQNRELRPRL